MNHFFKTISTLILTFFILSFTFNDNNKSNIVKQINGLYLKNECLCKINGSQYQELSKHIKFFEGNVWYYDSENEQTWAKIPLRKVDISFIKTKNNNEIANYKIIFETKGGPVIKKKYMVRGSNYEESTENFHVDYFSNESCGRKIFQLYRELQKNN